MQSFSARVHQCIQKDVFYKKSKTIEIQYIFTIKHFTFCKSYPILKMRPTISAASCIISELKQLKENHKTELTRVRLDQNTLPMQDQELYCTSSEYSKNRRISPWRLLQHIQTFKHFQSPFRVYMSRSSNPSCSNHRNNRAYYT
jgi:hypothetical protein